MINIEYRPKEHRISSEGHAGYAESGKDIVCAAVSILMNTLLITLKNMDVHDTGFIEMLDDGEHMDISCAPKNKNDKVETTFYTISTGLKALSNSYPEYVLFTEK